MPSLPTLSSTLTRLPPEAYNAKLLKDSAERALEKEGMYQDTSNYSRTSAAVEVCLD